VLAKEAGFAVVSALDDVQEHAIKVNTKVAEHKRTLAEISEIFEFGPFNFPFSLLLLSATIVTQHKQQIWRLAMTAQTLKSEIHQELEQLPIEQQRQVLEFARSLKATRLRGISGQSLLRFAGAIESSELAIMKQAIEEGCEQVNSDDW
jgi:hypothetical protein